MKQRRKGKVASKSRKCAIIEFLEPRVLYSADAFPGLSPDLQPDIDDLSQSSLPPWESLHAVLPTEKLLDPGVVKDLSAEQPDSVELVLASELLNADVGTLLAVSPAATTLLSAKVVSESGGAYESAFTASGDYSVTPHVTSVSESSAFEISDVDSAEQPASLSNTDIETDPVGALVFIDVRTPDYQVLLDDMQQNSPDTVFEYVLLNSDEDGLNKITETLSRYESVAAVHIVSHGSAGGVQLGSVILNDDLATARGSELLLWSDHLAENADILIYGCNLAATEDGEALVRDVAALTGADIASSDDLTGNAERGGDWDFEFVVGQIETDVVFSETVQANYEGVFETFTVDTLEDVVNATDGLTSLREAVIAANGSYSIADTIILGSGLHELTLMGDGDLDINTDIEIIGAADGSTVIDASKLNDRIFELSNQDTVFRHLTLQGGTTTEPIGGGAVSVNGGTTTAEFHNVVFSDNTAAVGGAIRNNAQLLVTDSTFDGNNSTAEGGAVALTSGSSQFENVTFSKNTAGSFGGAIHVTNGDHEFTNVTVSGNSTTTQGGGINVNSGNATINNATITANTAASGGGLRFSGGAGTVDVTGSIIAGNVAPSNADVDGTIGSATNSIIGNTTGLSLEPLADNGGAVQTHALQLDSVAAIDQGAAAAQGETDARGYLVTDGTRDIGAFEQGANPPAGQSANNAPTFNISETPTFTDNNITTTAGGASTVDTADLDGDGDLDVVSASATDNSFDWHENDGNGVFTSHNIATNAIGAGLVTIADIDGDGDLDVISGSSGDDTVAWHENDGSQIFTTHIITTTSAVNVNSVSVADIDGDGDLDVLSASGTNGGTLAWYENDGNQNFTTNIISDTTTSNNSIDASTITVADVDNDGDLDVLSASNFTGRNLWYENDGNQNYSEHIISNSMVSNSILSVTTADVDDDGDLDVLSAYLQEGRIAWYENDGSEVFTEHNITNAAGGAIAVSTADIDGDGDLDVLSADFFDQTFTWYENDGAQNFTDHSIATGEAGASSITTGDIDGDGDLDVITATSTDNTVAWHETEIKIISTLDNNPTFVEGMTVIIDPDVAIFDAELSAADDFNGSTIYIGRVNAANGDDVFSASGLLEPLNEGGNAVYDGTTVGMVDLNSGGELVIRFNANATQAIVNGVLQAISYSNSSDPPPASVDLAWVFDDNNSGSQGSGGPLHEGQTITVNITPVNDPPTFINLDGTPTFVLGGAPVTLDADVTIVDADVSALDNFNGALLTIREFGDHTLGINGAPLANNQPIVVSGGFTIGTVGDNSTDMREFHFNSAATNQRVNEFLQSITYEYLGTTLPTQESINLNWTFDDGTGSLAANGQTTVQLIESLPTDLSSGIELNTDGGNDAYLISNSGLATSLTATTFEIQFAATETADELVLMSFNNVAGDEYSIQTNGKRELEIDFGEGTEGISDAIDYPAILQDEQFHSLAVTWDNINGDWSIYLDGQFVDSGTGLNDGADLDTTKGQFVFGQEQDGRDTGYATHQIFSGTIYDVRIWDVVRSEADIALNYQNKFDSTPGSLPAGLVANWQMDGFDVNGTSQVVDVVSGNNLSVGHATGTGFTTSTPIGDLHIDENSANGESVGFVVATTEAAILAADPAITYNAENGKFYKYLPAAQEYADAQVSAAIETLNGVSGRLVTIASESENQFVADMIAAQGIQDVHLGASDAAVEGVWRWAHSGEQFSDAAGASVNGAFVGWAAGEPNNNNNEDFAGIFSSGAWNDDNATRLRSSFVEWDASEVLSEFTFNLTGDANGRFTINSSTGEITVSDGSQLNYEDSPSHDVTVKVTDAMGGVYNEVMTITVNDVNEAPIAGGFNERWLADETPLNPPSGIGSFHENAGHQVAQITIDGTSYYHGIGVAPTGNVAVIEYALNGATSFAAVAGLNDTLLPSGGGEVIFRAYVDDMEVFNSGTVDNDTPAIPVAIDITTGGGVLRLEVDTAGAEAADHAVWADPVLTGGANQPTTVSIAETATNNTLVGTYEGSDNDTGGTLTYSLADNASGRFAIDVNTGAITVANENLLNFEATNSSHSITVRIDDGTTSTDHAVTIELSDVNELPSGSNSTIAISEDTTHTFQGADFGFVDLEGDTLQAVHIASLPNGGGTLKLNSSPVFANQIIAVADLHDLVYTPAANANGVGYDSFEFTVRDSRQQFAANTNTLTFDVSPVNDAPEFLGVTAAATTPFINEIHYDNAAIDVGEAVEIMGTAGTDLTGWSLVRYSGAGGGEYGTSPLSGEISDQGNGFGTFVIYLPLQNAAASGSAAADGVALVNDSGNVVQFLSYEGVLTATDGPAIGLTSTDIGVEEPASTPAGTSMQLTDSGWVTGADETFGAQNTGQDLALLVTDYAPETIAEDTTLTFSSGANPIANAITIGDVDANGAELAMMVTVGNGVVSLGSTSGLNNLLGNGTGTITFTGTAADINIAMEGLTYDSDENFNGVDQLTITVNDQGNTGGGSLTDVANVAITVTAVNDAPVLTVNGTTINENSLNNTLTSGMLNGADVDDAPANLTFQITSSVSDGGLIRNDGSGAVVLSQNNTFTQADIDNGFITYGHDGSENATDSFDVDLYDGGEDGAAIQSGTFVFNVNQVNDAPVYVTTGTTSLTDINEDETNSAGDTVSSIIASAVGDRITDVDPGSVEGIALTAVDTTNGTWQYKEFSGDTWTAVGAISASNALLLNPASELRFVPGADYNGPSGDIEFKAWDRSTSSQAGDYVNIGSSGGVTAFSSATETASLNVLPVNDAPDSVDHMITLNEDGAHSFGLTQFGFSDVEPNEFRSVLITTIPTNGTLTFNGFDVTAGLEIDVVDFPGLLYTANPDVSGIPADSFTFQVRDNGGTANGGVDTDTTPNTINIQILAVNDVPVLTGGAVDNLTVDEDSGFTSLGLSGLAHFSGGGADEALQSLTYEVTLIPAASFGSIYLADHMTVVGTGTYTLAEIQGMVFNPAAEESGLSIFEFRVVDDGGTASGGADTLNHSMTLTVNPINDVPVIANLDGDVVNFDAGDSATLLDIGSDVLISDVDSTDYDSGKLTVSIASGGDATEDYFGILPQGSGPAQIDVVGTDVTYAGVVIGTVSNGTVLEVTFNANAHKAAVGALIKTIGYGNTDAVDPTTTSRVFDFVLEDGDGGTSLVSSVTVNVAANVAPESVDGSFTGNEDAASIALSISGSDPGGTIGGYRIISLPTHGTLYHDAELMFPVSPATLSTMLETVSFFYVPNADFYGLDYFEFAAIDNLGLEDATPENATLNVLAVNDAPVVDLDADDSSTTGLDYSTSFATGDAPVALTDGASVADVDSTIQTLTIQIANIQDGADEILSWTSTPNIATSYGPTTGWLHLSGNLNATNSDFAAVINSLTYENISATPDTTIREITLVANDGAVDSLVATAFVSMIGDATAPTAANNIGSSANEGATDLIETGELSYTDDLQPTNSIKYNVTSVAGNGFLALTTDPATPITSFTQADIDTGILVYIHDGSETVDDSFRFNVDDDQGNSLTGQIFSIAVVAQNDAPENTVPGNQVTDEDTPLVFNSINGNQISISDSDAGNSLVEVILSAGNGTITLGSTAGINITNGTGVNDTTITFQATQALANIALNGLSFSPTADYTGSAYVDILTNDLGNSGVGGELLDGDFIDITVDPINDAPTTTPIALTAITEDSGVRVITQAELLANANDIEGDNLTATGLVITSGNGVLLDNGDGTWDYTPALNDDADASFDYTITDGTNDVAGSGTLDISAVNDAPTTSPVTLTAVDKDSGVRLITQTELLGNASDIEADELTATGLAITAGNGTLVNNNDGTWNYTPAADDDTDITFAYTITDGINNIAASGTLDLVTVNNAPTATNALLTGIEDTPLILQVSDFGYSDLQDASVFQSVIIDTLPARGQLLQWGELVKAGDEISVADITAGSLVFLAAENDHGNAYDEFSFRVRDADGTQNGGNDTSVSANTAFVNITGVNDPPEGNSTTVQTNEDTPYVFVTSDFPFTDVDGDAFSGIYITSTPVGGVLTLSGTVVEATDFIDAQQINDGALMFTPLLNYVSEGNDTLGYLISDDGGTLNGGIDTDPNIHHITFDINAINDAPQIITNTVTLDEGNDKLITTEYLSGSDVDDLLPEELTYTLQTQPDNGELSRAGVVLAAGDQFTLAELIANPLRYQHDGSETNSDFVDLSLADGGEDGAAAALGRLSFIINEVLDQAPSIENDQLILEFGNSFRSADGDLLASGFATLGGNLLQEQSGYVLTIENPPKQGTLEVDPTGNFTYVHNDSAVLQDVFTYRVTNENGVYTLATVNILVEPPFEAAIGGGSVSVDFSRTNPKLDTEEETPVVDNIAETEQQEEQKEEPSIGEATPEAFGAPTAEARSDNLQASLVIDLPVRFENIGFLKPQVDDETLAVKQHNVTNQNEIGAVVQSVDKSYLEFVLDEKSYGVSNSSYFRGLLQLDSDFADAEATVDSSNKIALTNDELFGITFSATAGLVAWVLRGGALLASVVAATPMWASIDPISVFNGKHKNDGSDDVEDLFDSNSKK